jgi:CDP-diglyceride synthetase
VILAGLATLYFLFVSIQRPHPATILAVALWAAYAVWEYFIANGTLCGVNCNIRVDLILFFPLLAAASYLALKEQPRTWAVTCLYVVCFALTALFAAGFGQTLIAWLAGIGAVATAVIGLKTIRNGRGARV